MIKISRSQFNIILKAYQLFMIAAMFTTIFVIGYVQHKFLETLLSLVSFLALKQIYPAKLHNKSMAGCFVCSVLIFTVLTRLSFPVGVSLTCAPVLGLLTALAATKVALRLKEVEVLRSEVEGKSQLTLREQEVLRMIKLGMAQVDIAEALDPPVSARTIRRDKKNIEEKLNIKL